MKTKAALFGCILFASVLIFSGCDESSGSDNSGLLLLFMRCSPKPVVEVTSLSTTADTTWTNDTLWVIANSLNKSAHQLIIEPGTVIKFKDNYSISITGTGSISAVGTPKAHITFTSYYDDSKGCDTDGTTQTAAKGDWGSIIVGGSSNQFAYCDLYYGGSGANDSSRLMEVDNSITASIDHCTFANSLNTGLIIVDADTDTSVTNCVFYNNDKPLRMSPNFSIDGSNRFYNPKKRSQKNTLNGIWLQTSTDITADHTWGNNGVPYVSQSDFDISGAVLTVADGTIVKFTSGVQVNLTDAIANIANLGNAFFTSYRDDAHGGDTFNDGSTLPAKGDWDGIYSNPSLDWISNAGILYATHP